MSSDDQAFAEYMKSLREAAGLSHEIAARLIGVGKGIVMDWEAGKRFPSELSSQRISQVYKVSEREWLKALKGALGVKDNESNS